MSDDGEDFDDGGGESGSYEPAEDNSSRADVEEAVISQKQDRGDPDPHRSDRGYLRGRRLRRKSRFLVPRISNFEMQEFARRPPPVVERGPRKLSRRARNPSASRVSHSQTTRTCQPSAFRASTLAASRSLFRVNFGSQ